MFLVAEPVGLFAIVILVFACLLLACLVIVAWFGLLCGFLLILWPWYFILFVFVLGI